LKILTADEGFSPRQTFIYQEVYRRRRTTDGRNDRIGRQTGCVAFVGG